MIASDNHQMTAGLLQVHHKTVIEFARIAWGRSGIEDISGDDNGIYLLRLCNLKQPVQKSFMFIGTALTVKVLTQMPV
jgi:hypothetical protein